MKKILFFISLVATTFILLQYRSGSQVLPSNSQIEWSDCEIGVIIHLDINIFDPDHFNYSDSSTLPPLQRFNPSKLNTDQWIMAAKDAGARYAVLTAKHGTGFTLWPSKVHSYHIGKTAWHGGKGDIVGDFVASCKKYGIRPGLYYNTNFNTKYGAGYKQFHSEQEHRTYNQIVLQQLTELWTNYGKLFEIWFDGGIMADEKGGIAFSVYKLIKENQPKAILFQGPVWSKNLIRWVGNEDGRAPYPHWSTTDSTTSSGGIIELTGFNGKPDGKIWCPGESDFPNTKQSAWNGGWLWKANQDSLLFSANDLVDRYYTSVGNNANMLIGMAIDTSGLFPKKAAQIFTEFGTIIKNRFEKPLTSTRGSGNVLTLQLNPKSTQFNHIIIMENIAKGERIRKYHVEAKVDGTWKIICNGLSVGHKRIQKFDDVIADEIKLVVDQTSDVPQIRELAIYCVPGTR